MSEAPLRAEGLALYVHWPYCARICPYCDFNVTRARNPESQAELFTAMIRDLEAQSETYGPARLVSLYFGGGTPSLMRPEDVAEMIGTAQKLFTTDHGLEITLEANPTDAESGRFAAFARAGVNRLSLGVQALNDDALSFLGRNHSAREALNGLEVAQSVFKRVSADLIYALPDQTMAEWREALTRLARTGIEHISPYQLTIEPETAFGRAVRRGRMIPPPDTCSESLFLVTQEILAAEGFDAYEVSNHARGAAARSQHNLHVWLGGDYMGVGPGAHGRLGGRVRQDENAAHGRLGGGERIVGQMRLATVGVSDRRAYMAQVATYGTGFTGETLSPLEAEEERIMLGLRLSQGVAMAGPLAAQIEARAAPLVASGHMEMDQGRLRATGTGRLLLDRLIFELLS